VPARRMGQAAAARTQTQTQAWQGQEVGTARTRIHTQQGQELREQGVKANARARTNEPSLAVTERHGRASLTRPYVATATTRQPPATAHRRADAESGAHLHRRRRARVEHRAAARGRHHRRRAGRASAVRSCTRGPVGLRRERDAIP
jgi:hypothetical protein